MSIFRDSIEKTGPRKVRLYEGTYEPLDYSHASLMEKKFDILTPPQKYIGMNALGQFVFKLYDARGLHRGYQVRIHPWGEQTSSALPKASTYLTDTETPVQAFYENMGGRASVNDPLIVVEDPVSAIKAFLAGFSAVSLLSVALTMEKVREIASLGRPVLLAYDRDATELAFKDLQKWGPAFKKAGIIMLDQDIKNMRMYDVVELLESRRDG